MQDIHKYEDTLFYHISQLIEKAHQYVTNSVNTAMVYTYYEVGRYIVEAEQQGNIRAAYGKTILNNLSEKLMAKYGTGWSVETLTKCRKFYTIFSTCTISSTSQTESKIVHIVDDFSTILSQSSQGGQQQFTLSWSHYLILMRIKNPEERRFYEIECKQQNWTVRQLQRQYNSSLYERIALSHDKEKVLRLSQEGQTISTANDIIKNPLTLEFLGLKAEDAYTENRLENAIISKLQDFLLELGKGFLFEARQKRFTFDEDNFYVDLVFYNRLLQCYVLIDIKINKLTHQDLGQMQMYVNYFDRYVKSDFEKPTIGILLCKEKNDALVELTLPQDANIYATEYALYLPDKKELQNRLNEWTAEYEDTLSIGQANELN